MAGSLAMPFSPPIYNRHVWKEILVIDPSPVLIRGEARV